MLFTIITVVFNEVDTVEKTINSVLNQSYQNFEYIIIDGKSTDGTVDIIKKYDKDISYWVSEKDDGLYHAMNKGIEKARGEYISFLNANDWYEPNALEMVNKKIEESRGLLYYGKVKKYEKGIFSGYIGIKAKTDYEQLYFGNIYCHQGLFINKTLFNQVGLYNLNYKVLADYEWLIRAHEQGIDPIFIDCDVANFTMGGISCSEKSTIENADIVLANLKKKRIGEGCEQLIGEMMFEVFANKNEEKKVSDFFGNKRVYIWGCGYFGQKVYKLIKNKCKVEGFIDTYSNLSYLESKKIYTPLEVAECFDSDKDIIFVASTKYADEITKQLTSLNIKKFIGLSDLFDWIYKYYYTFV